MSSHSARSHRPILRSIAIGIAASMLTACAGIKPTSDDRPAAAQEIVLAAIGLIDTEYRYGGKDPDGGFDCSGMVSHIFDRAAGIRITGSAAEIAAGGRAIARSMLRGGDLVFFNTTGRSFSHVGVYIGNNRFVHAPSTRGKVRIDRLDAGYFDQRFDGARTYFD